MRPNVKGFYSTNSDKSMLIFMFVLLVRLLDFYWHFFSRAMTVQKDSRRVIDNVCFSTTESSSPAKPSNEETGTSRGVLAKLNRVDEFLV